MSWQLVPNPTPEETRELDWAFGKKARFLIDETLGESTVDALRREGWKAKSVAEVGLKGHSDEDVVALAWRDDLILLTQDHGYLDDGRFPPHRNPGIIILPDAPLDSETFANSLWTAVYVFGQVREAYRHAKITVGREGELTLRQRNLNTGAMENTRFRLGEGDKTYVWADDESE
jgi:predicted nuclease of predicted toxin-antitoxin system